MFSEFKKQPEPTGETPENKLEAEIESLRQQHPEITKAEYWDALKEAIVANKKFLKLVEPLTKSTPAGRSLTNPEERAAINADLDKILQLRKVGIPRTPANMNKEFQIEITQAEIDHLTNIQTARLNFRDEISLCDESFEDTADLIGNYLDQAFFLDPKKPAAGAMNKYFKVEEFCIPKILTGTLIFGETDWVEVFKSRSVIGGPKELDAPCLNSAGLNFGKAFFDEASLFSKIGLMTLKDQKSSAILEQLARHEAIHQVDFLRSKRLGINSLLSEIIAYRLDAKLDQPRYRKMDQDRLDEFVDDYLGGYSETLDLDKLKVKKLIDQTVTIIEGLEKRVGFERVTGILLNCESFAELFAVAKNIVK